MHRRAFLLYSAGTSAGVLAGSAALGGTAAEAADSAGPPSAAGGRAFVDDYTTNVPANLTSETNAAVRVVSGMQRLWRTGTAWNTGVALQPDVLRANVRYCVQVTTARTTAEAALAFVIDRRDQSYSATDGLGPLADLYRAGALAVTSITSAPDGTPPGPVNDGVPAGAPAGAAIGAGSPTSQLGSVVQLVNAVRGPYASGNQTKLAYQYPRPWRLTDDSTVVDTGAVDAYGYPVYRTDVRALPQLLRQRSTDPTHDGGFVSGHTNALYLAALALAYAIPERFQELVACASAYSHSRIVAGMHSPVDVIGGRILATALAAAELADPQNAALKAAARAQAVDYLAARSGTTADGLYDYAHSAGTGTDPFGDRSTNAAAVIPRLTYVLPRRGAGPPMVVPKGAEVLLETRLPYLGAAQRREVLRTTALPGGYLLLDGPELWGRLDLFTAADGYGAFDAPVAVTMDAAAGGYAARDVWRNRIGGGGSLTKRGTGTLVLAGSNRYCGGTTVAAGVLVAAGPRALGDGRVQVTGGVLDVASVTGAVQLGGGYDQAPGATLAVTLGAGGQPALCVQGAATLAAGSTLRLRLAAGHLPPFGTVLPVLRAGALRGRFGQVTVDAAGYRATPVYTAGGVSVRLSAR